MIARENYLYILAFRKYREAKKRKNENKEDRKTAHICEFATSVEDTTNIEDFIMPVKIPDAVEAALTADKIISL